MWSFPGGNDSWLNCWLQALKMACPNSLRLCLCLARKHPQRWREAGCLKGEVSVRWAASFIPWVYCCWLIWRSISYYKTEKTLQIIMIFYCHVSFWVCAFLFFPHLSKPRIREGAPNCLVEWGFPLNSWNWRDLPRWRWFRHCFFVKLSFTSQSPT